MRIRIAVIGLILILVDLFPGISYAQKTIQLATINWEPYTGEALPAQGFFSELVTESLMREGYHVEFKYYPWPRALAYTKNGHVHGLMDAYWKKDRIQFLEYPDVVWKVKEEFITLRGNPVTYTGTLASLKGFAIGVLRGSAQAEELKVAGLQTEEIAHQVQNVKKLLEKHINAVLMPKSVFFYHLEQIAPQFDRTRIVILKPPYKIYDMYVAFSKQKPGCKQLTADFNKGLYRIKADGTYEKILHKHHVRLEE